MSGSNSRAAARVTLFTVFLATLLSCVLPADSARAAGGGKKFVEGELLLQPRFGADRKKVDDALKGVGASAAGEISGLRIKKVRVPPHALERVKEALSRHPDVAFVEENFIAEASLVPNDQYYSSQWHLPKISAPAAWDLSTGSPSVTIAVIDSGVDPYHPDLAGKLTAGYNFLTESGDTADVLGHGTAVAGAAAAASDNFTGVAGVAQQNPVMPLVVLNADNWASYYDVARAIIYAADSGVRVINISLGGSSSSSTLQGAVDYAWSRGAVIVAAAANYSTNAPYYPAACDRVVAVSATTSSDSLASFSNYGSWVDLSAPGASIRTTSRGGGYGYWSGTSFSSPITAGLAALILSANPFLSNGQVVDIMTSSADDLGAAGFDSTYGHGRINAHRSLLAAAWGGPAPDTSAPSAAITEPSAGDTVSGDVTVAVTASDDTAVAMVELYVDGVFLASDSVEPYRFTWGTGSYGDGLHTLTAVARDGAGNSGQSAPVTVTVGGGTGGDDTVTPSVSITSPREGSSVRKNVNVQAAASDDREVVKVEFYLDGDLASVTLAVLDTYTWRWNTGGASAGTHVITVKAYDEAGNTAADSVTVHTSSSSPGGGGKKKK